MKIIPKKQQGGSFNDFFVNYAPVQRGQQQASQQPTQSSKPSNDGKLTEKDLFDMIGKIEGLPNEMKYITDNLIATFRMTELTGQSTTSLATKYLSNLYQIKVAAQNKENFDNAFKNAQTNGALAEPAITLDGKLVVQNADGKIQKVELSDYIKNADQYYALSVSQLANLRKFDPAMIQNQGAIDIINNGIGYEGFQNLISKSLRSLGSDTYTKEGLINTDAAQQGLALIQRLSEDDRVQAMGSITAEGLYKYKIIDKTQLNQINALTRYLTAALPDRAKTWAAYKMRIDDKNKATSALIQQFLLQGNNQEHSFTLDFKAKDEGKSGKGSGAAGDIPSTMANNFVMGYGKRENLILNPGSSYARLVQARTLPLTDKQDKQLPAGTLGQVRDGGYSGVLDWNNVTIGGVPIRSSAFNGIYIGDPKISYIDYPIDMEYYTQTNKIRPDTSPETARKKEDADLELSKLGIQVGNPQSVKSNYQKINEVYEKHDLPPAYDQNGEPLQQWRSFGVMNGIVNDNIIGDDTFDGNQLTQRVNMGEEELAQILKVMGDESFSTGWWGKDFMFEGTIWVPINENYTMSLTGASLTQAEQKQLDAQQQLLTKDTWKTGRKSQQ